MSECQGKDRKCMSVCQAGQNLAAALRTHMLLGAHKHMYECMHAHTGGCMNKGTGVHVRVPGRAVQNVAAT
eukprot:1137833-Pelagomonas_calceolata.AAC.3